MHNVIQKVYNPAGEQIDSDSIAEFDNLADADAMAERLCAEQNACPPNADEARYEWFVISE